MSNTIALRTTVIAADRDAVVFASGGPVYGGGSEDGLTPSYVIPLPGTVVFYNPETGLSTGTAATKSTVPLLQIGVAVSYSGDTNVSDDIIWFNDGFNGCSIQNMSGRASACGTGSIVDALWNGNCLECNKTYTIRVEVYDPFTETFGKAGEGHKYAFSYTLPCGDCTTGDCVQPTPNSDEVMCGLYNKIKGIHPDPSWSILYNGLPLPGDHEYRFDVAMLYDDGSAEAPASTTFEYCLTATDGDCTDCTNYTDIGGYNLTGGEETDVVFSPATFSEVDEETLYSSKKQIISAVAQLNTVLSEQGGSAVFLPAVGNCCDNNKIEINTCLVDFVLNDGAGVPIVPCDDSNPFDEQTIYSECQDCDSSNTTRSYTNGLRFFSKPVEHVCDCIPGNIVLAEYFSEVEVYFDESSKSWPSTGVRTVRRQLGSLPKNQGFQWNATELANMHEGFRQPFIVDNNVGKYGLPSANDYRSRLTTKCLDSYCSLEGVFAGKTKHTEMGETAFTAQSVALLLKTGNTTAITSVLTAWNNYFAGGDCGLATITCASW